MEEDEWKELLEKKWSIFWKRYDEEFHIERKLEYAICKKMEKMFEKTTHFYGEERDGLFRIDNDGKIVAFEPFYLLLGAIANIILEEAKNIDKVEYDKIIKKLDSLLDVFNNTTEKNKDEIEKVLRYLKYAIPELEELIECPFCKEYNPPDGLYCIRCTKKITMEKSNEKDK